MKDEKIFEIEELRSEGEGASTPFEITIRRQGEISEAGNKYCHSFWYEKNYVKIFNGSEEYKGWYLSYHTTAKIPYCSGCGRFGFHYEERATIMQGNKILGYTKQLFPCGREIFVD